MKLSIILPCYNEEKRIGSTLEEYLKFFDGIKIYASDGGNVNPSRDLKKISRHVMKNFKYFKNFISHTVSLKNINLGFQLLKNGKTLRVGIKF
jgi:Zn-dependent alcohol dehydrogenase